MTPAREAGQVRPRKRKALRRLTAGRAESIRLERSAAIKDPEYFVSETLGIRFYKRFQLYKTNENCYHYQGTIASFLFVH
ncbi:hypothetical protein [Jeotgalibacillus salarius]|uniref:hypothetical protein n=1 Tax=Jeotgalibacillus salarius TaxID=546023 RepID=UPI00141BD4B9|nr:hypothetical protein [Jeotgalibacillus salarius]